MPLQKPYAVHVDDLGAVSMASPQMTPQLIGSINKPPSTPSRAPDDHKKRPAVLCIMCCVTVALAVVGLVAFFMSGAMPHVDAIWLPGNGMHSPPPAASAAMVPAVELLFTTGALSAAIDADAIRTHLSASLVGVTPAAIRLSIEAGSVHAIMCAHPRGEISQTAKQSHSLTLHA